MLRFGTTKTRTGCITCKSRRVKCDEAKSTCQRCRKGNRSCAWPFQPAGVGFVHYLAQPRRAVPTLPQLRPRDLQALDYFISHTCAKLVGTWKGAAWVSTILQCAISEPAIQRVSIALGALHEIYDTGAGESQQHALSQYVQAIGMITNNIHQQHLWTDEVLLLASILFCMFENMSYHLDSAVSHLSGGMGLTLQHGLGQVGTGSKPFSTLLLRLDDDRMCLGAPSPRDVQNDHVPDLPVQLTGIYDAQTSLTEVINLGLRQLMARDLGGQLKHTGIASRWVRLFDDWLPEHLEHVRDEDMASLLAMHIWRNVIQSMLDVDIHMGELAWDALHTHYESIVECAELFEVLTADTFAHGEDWKHPMSYIKETAFSRTKQSFKAQERKTTSKTSQDVEDTEAEFHASKPSIWPSNDRITLLPRPDTAPSSLCCLLGKARAIKRCRDLASGLDSNQDFAPRRPTFTLSLGIVYPLYTVMTRCRDPSIRRRALAVLRRCDRSEGLWDSNFAAQQTARIMMIEETEAQATMRTEMSLANGKALDEPVTITSAQQIPVHCRVKAFEKTFLADGRAIERFGLSPARTDVQSEPWSRRKPERWIEFVADV